MSQQGTLGASVDAADRLRPYVAGLAVDWLQTTPDVRHRSIEGSLAFVDISGFTTLTERLAAKGKVGAEEMSDLLNASFATLLEEAYAYGALLVKWGGDAVLLLFEGPEHALLASRAAFEMRRTMRRIGRLQTSVGVVQLKMSVGVDSGSFDFFMAGRRHRELLVAGPAATATAVMEQTAEAGEIVVSAATAEQLPGRCVGAAKGDGFLLRGAPPVDPRCRYWPRLQEAFDFGSCLDPAIRDHLMTEVGDNEHRQIAVGFVEISGVDDLLVRQGPGAVASALHELLVLVQEECHRHHVTFWETDISKDGFKIMLVAGAPRSSGRDEDGMLRATRAVLDQHTGPIRVRIGINSGRVFNGGFGPAFRRTWSVKGDAINLAARVMGKAGTGELLATEMLLRRATSRIEADLLPPFLVKGKQHPVHAAVVRTVTADRVEDSADTGAFVGRRDDVDALLEAASAVAHGAGGAVAVLGAPGLGKSRLVDHVCRRLSSTTAVHRSFGDLYERTTAYSTIRRLLRGMLAIPSAASDTQAAEMLRAVVRTSAPQLEPMLPILAVAFGVSLPDSPETAAVQERFRRPRTASLVVELLRAVLATPTVFVVDDVGASDDASVELLARIVAEAARQPWLVMLVGRSLPPALADGSFRRLELGGLPEEDARTLVLDRPDGDSLPPHVVRAIVERGEGNPLFLRELTAAALTSESGELPGTLEELLAVQVDDLAPGPRSLLRTVSVLGTRFDPGMAEPLLGETPTPEQWAGVEHFLAAHADGTKRFRSALVRDAAYEGLPFRRRVELHGRAATALRARADAGGADATEALSLHSFAAQQYADAWRYSLDAGRRAQAVYANVEALAFYDRARAAARRLSGVSGDEIASLCEAIGDVHARLAELEHATAAYREARKRASREQILLRARVALSAGLIAERAGAMSRAARWMSMAHRDLADLETGGTEAAPAAELDCRVWVERAFLCHTTGRAREAAKLCARAIEGAEAAGADDVLGRALHLLDLVELAAGSAGDEARVERARDLFERCGDLPRQAGAWNHLGMRAYFRGDWDAAVQRYRQAQDIHERSGDEWSAAICSANVAEILLDQGQLVEAEPLITAALQVWRASGAPSYIAFGAVLLGRLFVRSGRYAEGVALLGEAVATYSSIGERFEVIDAELRIAEALLLRGQAGTAIARLQETERQLLQTLRSAGLLTAEELPAAALQAATLWRLRGCALAQLGELTAATEQLALSVESARARGAVHDLALALHAVAWLGADEDDVARPEADQLCASLGIKWVPDLPPAALTPAAAEEIVIPAQRAVALPVGAP